MPRKAASPHHLMRSEITAGKWQIDRSGKSAAPMSLQMARALIHLRRFANDGAATASSLVKLGFTFDEIRRFGKDARLCAIKLAPDLAHQADKDFAAATQAERFA